MIYYILYILRLLAESYNNRQPEIAKYNGSLFIDGGQYKTYILPTKIMMIPLFL